ncbi:MAG: alpha/beta fold hydrolase [Roseiarcus sp.]
MIFLAFASIVVIADPALLRAAEPSERVRATQILDRLMPVSPRAEGTAFDIRNATKPEPCAIETISCPVLTISAADDAFGTADRASAVAAGVRDSRAAIHPTGGHALVGRYEEARREILSFLAGP